MHQTIRRSDDDSFCFSRRKYGKGFSFFDENNARITNKKLLKRLRALVIPPMWSEVLICRWTDGHVQATGRDLKGRKQYIYHSKYERIRQEKKFAKMKKFGAALPQIREKCYADIAEKNWGKDMMLALLVLILDETGIRIGNRQYARRNGTIGLTTMRRKHMEIEDDTLIFHYKGKSNQEREVEINDDELVKFIKKSAELPGYEIFRYKNRNGDWENVDSDEVNDYIRKNMGEKFSGKDFRTWAANRLSVEYYPQALEKKQAAPRKKFSNILIRAVAEELGNTPAVCKDYYVHPKILQRIDNQSLPKVSDAQESINDYELSPEEKLVLKLI